MNRTLLEEMSDDTLLAMADSYVNMRRFYLEYADSVYSNYEQYLKEFLPYALEYDRREDPL